MPTYHYDCHSCGPFEASRPMAQAFEPHPCPCCEADAARGIAAPYTRNSSAGLRYRIEARNERSAHEPMLERRLKAGTGGHHRHQSHGSHALGHKPAKAPPRPWMIGH